MKDKLLVKLIVLTNLLIFTLDDLEEHKLFRYMLKKAAKQFKIHLEKLLDATWNRMSEEDKKKHTEAINIVTSCFEDSVELLNQQNLKK